MDGFNRKLVCENGATGRDIGNRSTKSGDRYFADQITGGEFGNGDAIGFDVNRASGNKE